jgi:hypothetical protein
MKHPMMWAALGLTALVVPLFFLGSHGAAERTPPTNPAEAARQEAGDRAAEDASGRGLSDSKAFQVGLNTYLMAGGTDAGYIAWYKSMIARKEGP